MKVTTTPSMTPTRRPARPMEPLSLPPPYGHGNHNGSTDLGSMAARIGISCPPVSISDGGTNHPIQRQPVCHQLFRSLDTSVHHHHNHNFCNHGGCNPNNANNPNYPNHPRSNNSNHNDGIPLVVSPSPPRSSPPLPFWTTPPPSPFGSKTTTTFSSSFGMTTALLKTPSSVRTAETESIVSSASTTPLRDREGSSPVPSRTTATTRPRTTLVPSLPGNSSCRQGPLFSALLPHPPLANGGSAANMRSNHPNNTRKASKNRVSDLPPAAQQAYDNSNHSRHSIHSTCSRSNNSSPSLGLDSHSHSSHSVHSSSYAAGSSTHHKSKTTSNNNNNRSKKVKTELCLYYLNNEPCPYGDGCHYAHGQEELQTKGLLDLQNLGLIEDASTYRIKPCFSHVAMGSCPFGKRCACLHDPRVTGTVQSWLPITETQGNNIMTDINVEGLHQKRRFDILYGDPFVGESRLSAALMTCGGKGDGSPYDYRYDWSDLYHMVANIRPTEDINTRSRGTGTRRRGGASGIRSSTTTIGIHHTTRRQHQSIWEVHKLSMALQMHGGTHRWMYKYRPSHMIFNEHCMVLDKRAFRLDEASGKAIPLPLSKYKPEHPQHCLVREIAFGPDQDPSVRPVALWFNISGDKVTECTLHKQKLFRWHKNKKSSPSKTVGSTPDSRKGFSSSPFDGHDSFVMVRPIDREAFGLVRDILEHRYATVLAKGIKSIRGRSETLERLGTEYYLLQEHFSNLKRHWRAWDYPRAAGRPPIDEHAPVPPADATYEPVRVGDAVDPPEALEGVQNETQELWESFVRTLEASKLDDAEDDDWSGHDYETSYNPGAGASYLLGPFRPPVATPRVEHRRPRPRCRNRLSVFVRLSRGQGENRSLPHIQHRHGTSSEGGNAKGEKGNHNKPKDSYLRQSERCWKSLFLPNDALQEAEWDVVVNHFTNSSRSQKVLNIVQQ